MSRLIRTYYWNRKPNFGDALTTLLLKRFSLRASEWAEPREARLVVVGSILEQLPNDWRGIIAGAGKLHEKTTSLPNATVMAVRGPLTAKDFTGNFVIGDPGLLADELVPLEDKKYNLGVVPHWTDNRLAHDPRFTKYNPLIIDVRDDPLNVISNIGRCKKIVSSSLHGIILADAFGIPRRIELAPKMLTHPHQEGGLFKWRDYSASIGVKLEIGKTKEISRNTVVEKQHELFDVFKEIERVFPQTL